MELNAELKQLRSLGETYGNDEEPKVGYSLEMRRWTREFVARDYVLEVKDLGQSRRVRRLVKVDDAAEAIGLATMVNERIRKAGRDFEAGLDAWWAEVCFIVDEAANALL